MADDPILSSVLTSIFSRLEGLAEQADTAARQQHLIFDELTAGNAETRTKLTELEYQVRITNGSVAALKEWRADVEKKEDQAKNYGDGFADGKAVLPNRLRRIYDVATDDLKSIWPWLFLLFGVGISYVIHAGLGWLP